MRNHLLSLSGLGVIGSSAVWVLSCANLPAITAGQCGNAVLETGEDCDTFPAGDGGAPGTCIAPGQVGQCHFACDPAAASASASGCPPTFACGADSICRKPSGAFRPPLAVAGEAAKSIQVGDFDGDHASDVVALGTSATRIYFFDGQAQPKPITLSTSSTKPPALGRLASDGRTSAVVVSPTTVVNLTSNPTVAGGDLRVWRGSADRTLLPTIYAGLDLTKQGFIGGRMVPVFIPSGLGSEIVALGSGNGLPTGEYGIFDVVGSQLLTQPKLMFGGLTTPDGPNGIAGEIPTGGLGNGTIDNGFTTCEAIVLAYVGASQVGVFPTCTDSVTPEINYASSPNHKAAAVYSLGSVITGRAFLVPAPATSINPNPSLDLFVATSAGLMRLAGQPDGSFGAPVNLGIAGAASTFAVGYLNPDTTIDWVDPKGIHIGGAPFPTPPLGGTWIDARMADFNGNGLTDVVALATTGIDFYNGSGIGFENGLHIPVDGTAEHLAVGDFDGDFLADFAVTTSGDSTGLASNNLLVSFGNFTSFPDAPLSIGRLDAVQQLSPAFFDYRITGSPDFINTLFAIGTASGDLVAATLQGSPDRLINSPFFLDPTQGSISLTTVGDFANTGHPGLAGLALKFDAVSSLHIWSVQATGDAQLDATKVVEGQANAPIDPLQVDGASLVALDVGGAPGDELVGIAPTNPVQPNQKGAFVIGALGATDWSLVSGEPVDGYPVRDGGSILLQAPDVDGDGTPDLLLAYRDAPAKQNGQLVAKLLFNDKTGTLSLANAITLAVPAGTLAMTTTHASADGVVSLVALTRDRIFLAPMSGRTVGDFAEVASFGTDAPSSDRQSFDIASGDVDGDGVDDLIVGTSTGFLVFFGVPAVAGGGPP